MGFCGWWGFLLLEKESPSEVSDCEVLVGCTPPTADVGPLSILKLDHVLRTPRSCGCAVHLSMSGYTFDCVSINVPCANNEPEGGRL